MLADRLLVQNGVWSLLPGVGGQLAGLEEKGDAAVDSCVLAVWDPAGGGDVSSLIIVSPPGTRDPIPLDVCFFAMGPPWPGERDRDMALFKAVAVLMVGVVLSDA